MNRRAFDERFFGKCPRCSTPFVDDATPCALCARAELAPDAAPSTAHGKIWTENCTCRKCGAIHDRPLENRDECLFCIDAHADTVRAPNAEAAE